MNRWRSWWLMGGFWTEPQSYAEKADGSLDLSKMVEWKEVWSAMLQTNKYLRAIGAPESEMYDI